MFLGETRMKAINVYEIILTFIGFSALFALGYVILFIASLFFLTLPLLYILNGWVLSILWEWFVVSTFEISPLTIPEAIGLAALVSFLTCSYQSGEPGQTNEERIRRIIESICYSIARPLVVLILGWIVHQFI